MIDRARVHAFLLAHEAEYAPSEGMSLCACGAGRYPGHAIDHKPDCEWQALVAMMESEEIEPLPEMERRAIEHALKVFGPNKKVEAARALGISPRTLLNKIHAYGLPGYIRTVSPRAAAESGETG